MMDLALVSPRSCNNTLRHVSVPVLQHPSHEKLCHALNSVSRVCGSRPASSLRINLFNFTVSNKSKSKLDSIKIGTATRFPCVNCNSIPASNARNLQEAVSASSLSHNFASPTFTGFVHQREHSSRPKFCTKSIKLGQVAEAEEDSSAGSKFDAGSTNARATGAALTTDVEKEHTDPSAEAGDHATTEFKSENRKEDGERDGDATSLASKPKLISYDYGFQASFLRKGAYVPGNVIRLAVENFGREYTALRRNILFEELSDVNKDNIKRTPTQTILAYSGRFFVAALKGLDKILTLYDGLPALKPEPPLAEDSEDLRQSLSKLTLSNDAVWDREKRRPAVEAPWLILGPYYALCLMLDVIFNNRPIQRFWFLETVARMPYFSYISMLHLYETLGWWRVGAEVRKVHFAEEWNEMNHLKIMESLGGDRLWIDRFFGQHAAFFYYWILNTMFLISPRIAYNFSELIEFHAVDTYAQFVDENEELLKTLPPSPAAIAYYCNEDLYMFDEFQTSQAPESRRPKIDSLYDVFSAIRDDEKEHVKTMSACQNLDTPVVSPNRSRSKSRQD